MTAQKARAHRGRGARRDRSAPGRPSPGRRDQKRARADRAEFARHLAGDPTARDRLVERFLPLAHMLARRYGRRGEPFDDLLQVASLGLVKAIDRFDPHRGIAFTSFAVPTILGEIKRHFRDHTWAVRVSRRLQEMVLRVDDATDVLTDELRRSPSVGEIAARLDASEEEVLEALEAGRAHDATSLQAHVGGDADADTLAGRVRTEEPGFEASEDRATLERLFRTLTARQREVLRLRFEEDLTQREIGEMIGVSQMQVSRIVRQSVSSLQRAASSGQ